MGSLYLEDGEARAGFLPADHANAADPGPVIAAVLHIDAPAPLRQRTLSAKFWVSAALIVVASQGIWRAVDKPAAAPLPPAPVIVHETVFVPQRVEAEPPRKPREEPAQIQEVKNVDEPKAPERDDEEARRQALTELSDVLARRLQRAGELIDALAFNLAEEEIDQASAEIQRFPNELARERDELRRLQRRLIEVRVGVETARAKQKLEEAEWERRLALIETQIENGSFPEAAKLAASLIDDPSIPQSITDRAKDLRKRATDGLKEIFGQTKAGPATNTIRKPSSPPRN